MLELLQDLNARHLTVTHNAHHYLQVFLITTGSLLHLSYLVFFFDEHIFMMTNTMGLLCLTFLMTGALTTTKKLGPSSS
jgi:hypothetical protein